jgi:hypothetical protein
MRVLRTWVIALAALAVAGCCRGWKQSEKQQDDPLGLGAGSKPKPITTLTAGDKPKLGADPVAPSTPKFDRSFIRPIAETCSDGKIVFAIITRSVFEKPGFHWRWADQVMLASPEFRVVPHAALFPGTIAFMVYDHGSSGNVALVGHCGHGGTCNDIAAAYKAIVRSSSPQIFCGSVPGLGRETGMQLVPTGNRSDLPGSDDVISQCARVAACMIRADPNTPGDPGLECQRAPSGFKVSCASRYPCSEVMACMKR